MMERTAQQSLKVGGDATTTTGMDATTAGASHLLSVSRATTVKVWDVETGFSAQTLNHHLKKCEREFGDHVCEKSTWRHAVGTKTNAEPNQ